MCIVLGGGGLERAGVDPDTFPYIRAENGEGENPDFSIPPLILKLPAPRHPSSTGGDGDGDGGGLRRPIRLLSLMSRSSCADGPPSDRDHVSGTSGWCPDHLPSSSSGATPMPGPQFGSEAPDRRYENSVPLL